MEILKLLFWIATLYSCLQALPIEERVAVCRKGSLKLREMKSLTCEENSTFYTPPTEPKCLTAALDCIRAELKTAQQECDDQDEYIDQGISYLDLMINDSPDKNQVLASDDCACEGWPTNNFTMFLNALEALCELKSSLEQSASAH